MAAAVAAVTRPQSDHNPSDAHTEEWAALESVSDTWTVLVAAAAAAVAVTAVLSD